MNSNAFALVSILSRCAPDQKELKREEKIQKIIFSRDYAELSCRKAFKTEFDSGFSEERLRSCTDAELDQISRALPAISPCLEDILFSLKNGCGPQLTPADRPDFFSQKSLEALSEKLQDASGKNITNIEPDEFMTVFEDSTVKKVEDVFWDFPDNALTITDGLPESLRGKKYCLSVSEFDRLEEAYEQELQEMKKKVLREQNRRGWRRLFKLLIGIGFLFIPTFFAALTGMLSAGAVATATIMILVLVLVYGILG